MSASVRWARVSISKALNFIIPGIFGVKVMPFLSDLKKIIQTAIKFYFSHKNVLFKKNSLKVFENLLQYELSSTPLLTLHKKGGGKPIQKILTSNHENPNPWWGRGGEAKHSLSITIYKINVIVNIGLPLNPCNSDPLMLRACSMMIFLLWFKRDHSSLVLTDNAELQKEIFLMGHTLT